MNKEPHVHQLITLDNGMGMAIGPCYKTGEEYSTKAFNLIGYMSWILKEDNIQVCLPELNDEDREFLISGISPNGWNLIFDNEWCHYSGMPSPKSFGEAE